MSSTDKVQFYENATKVFDVDVTFVASKDGFNYILDKPYFKFRENHAIPSLIALGFIKRLLLSLKSFDELHRSEAILDITYTNILEASNASSKESMNCVPRHDFC